MKERKYETVYILRPDLTEEMEKKVNEKVTGVVERFQGTVDTLRDLGKKPLAYRIAKHLKGRYVQLNYKGSGQVVDELERFLRLSEDVIRFLTVRDEGLPTEAQLQGIAGSHEAPAAKEEVRV